MEQGGHPSEVCIQDTRRRWKPQRCSILTLLLLSAGLVILAVSLIGYELGMVEGLRIPQPLIPVFNPDYLPAGVAVIVAALVGWVISLFRVPPPRWRVKNDLTRALIDLGLLDRYDMDYWKGSYWVSPFGRYSWKTKSYSILFDIKNVNATEEKFRDLESSIAGFTRSQDVSIEHWTAFGNRQAFKLTIWFSAKPSTYKVF